MKANGFMRILSVFITGLVLCGVGAGVCIAEWTQFKIVRETDEETHFTQTYQLPENEPLYIDNVSDVLVLDESVNEGEAVMDVVFSENYTFDFKPITRQKLAEFNTDGTHREWSVKALVMPEYERRADARDDMYYFKQMISHLRSKEIYVHVDSIPAYTVKINPKDRDRIICVWDHNKLMLTDADEVIDDDFLKNRDDEAEYEYDDDYYDDMEEFEEDMDEFGDTISEAVDGIFE
ncbi:MAG: hypothetical protein IJR45_06970 [Firmicutes bacterium]|nr:hypothetical protein [Bacillota bacterium]